MAVRVGANGQAVSALPVIELHNYVFRARVRSLSELVANNGFQAGVILPNLEQATAHPACAKSGTLEVRINDKLTDSGPLWSMPVGAEEPLAWLKHHLRDHGFSLQAGLLISTGTPLVLHHVKPGDHIRVLAEGCGEVEASVIE
jgi:2-keto-4-pentenoate hydratase